MTEYRFDVEFKDLTFYYMGRPDPRAGDLSGALVVRAPAERQVHIGLGRLISHADLSAAVVAAAMWTGGMMAGPDVRYAATRRVHELLTGIGSGLLPGERADLLAALAPDPSRPGVPAR